MRRGGCRESTQADSTAVSDGATLYGYRGFRPGCVTNGLLCMCLLLVTDSSPLVQRYVVLAGLGLVSAVSAFAPAPVAPLRSRGMLLSDCARMFGVRKCGDWRWPPPCRISIRTAVFQVLTDSVLPSCVSAGVSAVCAPSTIPSSTQAGAGSFARLHLKPAAARRRLAPRMAVDVDVKDLPGSQKKLTIKVSGDECTNAYESVLSRLVRGAEIPGFRKGKAPPQMVLNHFGKKSISAEACESIIGAAVPLALQQKDIRAIGQARMADEEAMADMLEGFKPGDGLEFDVLVDVWPEAQVPRDASQLSNEPRDASQLSNEQVTGRWRLIASTARGAGN